MRDTQILLTVLLALGIGGAGVAQTQQADLAKEENEKSTSGRTLIFVKVHNDTVLYEIIRRDRPVTFRDAAVPHFAIHTNDNKFILTIGGNIQPIIGWDLGNELYEMSDAGSGFVNSQIPVPHPRFKGSDFYINALNGHVNLQVIGFGGTPDQLTGFIQIGTDGWSNHIKMKKMYVTWRGIRMGLAHTLFQDELACQPPMIDPQGPCGEVATSNYQLSYTTPSFKGFRAAVGVEIPAFNSSNGRYLGKDYKTWKGKDIYNTVVCDPTVYNQMVPDIPLWVEWAKDDGNRVRVSGILRTLTYRDVLEQKRRNAVGWGVMLSGNFTPVDPLTFYAQAIYGKGIGNYIQDMAGVPLSFTPRNSKPGELTPTPEMGLMFGLTYNINKRWQMNAVYSPSRMWDVGEYALANGMEADNDKHLDNYRYSTYVGANCFYNISSFLQVGVEYIYGQRKTYYQGSAHDNRITAAVNFIL